MIKLIVFFALILSCQSFGSEKSYIIKIFANSRGGGLQNGRILLKQELEGLGHIVFEKENDEIVDKNEPLADINIFIQSVPEGWTSYANVNWFIPNPDCFIQKLSVLNDIDLVLCRTRDSEKIFQALGKKTYYLGFTSRDCYLKNINKDFSTVIHLAGRSFHKGTRTILNVWKHHLKLPFLYLIYHGEYHNLEALVQRNIILINEKLPFSKLQLLQNSCGIHLCPSEIEGYGHYIMEGMSTGGVVLTTDAPPMNEFIKDSRCLIPYHKTKPFNLGTEYIINPRVLRKKILEINSLPLADLIKIGGKNREAYLQRKNEFHQNLKALMKSVEITSSKKNDSSTL